MTARIVAGVDEVGRGPLAGPVLAAAVVLTEPVAGLADSKTLSPGRREAVCAELRRSAVIGLAAASVREIAVRNIRGATLLAMRRAVMRLRCRPELVLVDGRDVPEIDLPARALVGGDREEPAIAAASIVAKVVRDRLMARLAERYPGFGWQDNAGYGTASHLAALRALGPTPHHRAGFRPVAEALAANGAQPLS